MFCVNKSHVMHQDDVVSAIMMSLCGPNVYKGPVCLAAFQFSQGALASHGYLSTEYLCYYVVTDDILCPS